MDHTEQSSPVLIMATPLRRNSARDKMASSERNISCEEKNAQSTEKVLNFTAPAIIAYYIRHFQQHVI